MASKIKVKSILELRDAHMSRNNIASTRNMYRSSLSDVFHIADLPIKSEKLYWDNTRSRVIEIICDNIN